MKCERISLRSTAVLAIGLAGVLAACAGGGASASSNGGRISVSKTGTYTYKLHVACLTPTTFSPTKSTAGFQLIGPGGFYEGLHATRGKVWLTAGSWHGAPGYFSPFDPARANLPPTFRPQPCFWSLRLSLASK